MGSPAWRSMDALRSMVRISLSVDATMRPPVMSTSKSMASSASSCRHISTESRISRSTGA